MGRYVSASSIKDAQLRLSASRATPGLIDYLVFKRAAILEGGPDKQVPGGTRSYSYQKALSEWKGTGLDGESAKFFNPVEPASTSTAGFKSSKHTSNGPDNTWAGWQSSMDPTPVMHVRGTSNPKHFQFQEVSGSDLRKYFLTGKKDSPLPRLVDLAVWWLRARDLETLDIDESSAPAALLNVVVEESGITPTEIEALFDIADLSLD